MKLSTRPYLSTPVQNDSCQRHRILFDVRASYPALLRHYDYRLYSKWQNGRAKQAGPSCKRICPPPTGAGTANSASMCQGVRDAECPRRHRALQCTSPVHEDARRRKQEATTTTLDYCGAFAEDSELRREFWTPYINKTMPYCIAKRTKV